MAETGRWGCGSVSSGWTERGEERQETHNGDGHFNHFFKGTQLFLYLKEKKNPTKKNDLTVDVVVSKD